MLTHPSRDATKPTIIGGMFGLELGSPRPPGNTSPPAILSGRHLTLATAKGAFALLARSLRPGTVWLPSFLCGVVLRALAAPIRFYAIDQSLRVADDGWVSEVREGDMVVFIDYFGFRAWDECATEVRRRGAWVVEDACQAMLNSCFCEQSHYVIASPRKFLGVPDGGILAAQVGAALPELPEQRAPVDWLVQAIRASVLRAEFDRNGGDRFWFELYRLTEANGPDEPARMSELTELLLDNGVNWSDLCLRRRENYRYLASALGEIAMTSDLPQGVVPMGFPIRLHARDRVRQALFAEQIYPPVHWPIPDVVPAHFAASHQLAAEIMTIPCDQRYDAGDLERAVQCINRARREIS